MIKAVKALTDKYAKISFHRYCGYISAETEGYLASRLTGWRKISGANTNCLIFDTPENTKSYLEIPKKALVEVCNDKVTTAPSIQTELLRIYAPAFRFPNEKEQKVLDEWEKISSTDDFRKRMKADILTDSSSTYWQEKGFFSKYDMLYLAGFFSKKENQLSADYKRKDNGLPWIRDPKIRGELMMEYIISDNIPDDVQV